MRKYRNRVAGQTAPVVRGAQAARVAAAGRTARVEGSHATTEYQIAYSRAERETGRYGRCDVCGAISRDECGH